MRLCKIISFILIFYLFGSGYTNAEEYTSIINEQKNTLGIAELLKESEKYTNDIFDDMNLSEVLEEAVKGKVDNARIMKGTLKIFGNEITDCITLLCSIIVIVIINSILNCVTDGLENKSVGKVAYYVQFILIVTVMVGNFSKIISSVKDSVNNMVAFTNMLIPILIALVITTGNITTATIIQPIIIFITTLIGNFINYIAIPILLVSTALGIISKISDKVQVDKLAKKLMSGTTWIIGIILTIFVTVISIDSSLTGSVDAVTSKTSKAVVSSLVPVVGKILGDAVDSVIGCSNILKNALGTLGVIIIIGIGLVPIVKLLLLMAAYHITAAVCEPIADSKIVKLLEQMGNTFKQLMAFMCSMTVVIIVGTTIVIKISSSG